MVAGQECIGDAGRPRQRGWVGNRVGTASIRKPSSGLPLIVVNRVISTRMTAIGWPRPRSVLNQPRPARRGQTRRAFRPLSPGRFSYRTNLPVAGVDGR
jgi:hypothetical protein